VQDRSLFEYVVIRIVPRVDRQEFINAGVILICRRHRFLAARIGMDCQRLQTLFPGIEDTVLQEIENQLQAIASIAIGDAHTGPIAKLDMGERWHWLSAPSSTIIQPSPIHTGFCADPAEALDDLYRDFVLPLN
jgi:Protein of unknown function (DUF3037)